MEKKHITFAITNVSSHGDTDVFPFGLENHVFFDEPAKTTKLLADIHTNFDDHFNRYPPVNEHALSPVGYTGFRWATQIDPVWNLYFLALVASIGNYIEAKRVPVSKKVVFSYRFAMNQETGDFFDRSIGWSEFQKHTLSELQNYGTIAVCDIADFYPRIYHHRLENALIETGAPSGTINRVRDLLQKFSNTVSYGLPVGGPAARLLAELVLNRVDHLLLVNGIPFCRFADDYHIFAKDVEEAYAHVIFLTEKLLLNDGLSLQKAKTRIMSATEFARSSIFAESETAGEAGESDRAARNFLKLHLRYDPYSPTAKEDYERLRSQIGEFDVTEMLTREIAKTKVHGALTRKLIGTVKFLEPEIKDEIVLLLIENTRVLAPVFPNVLQMLKEVYSQVSDQTRDKVDSVIRDLINSDSYIMRLDLNVSYAIRVLAERRSEENLPMFVRLFRNRGTLVRRDIILIMAKYGERYWLSDLRHSFGNMGPWERKAFIVASYFMGDEGNHWRTNLKREFSPSEVLFRDWTSQRVQSKGWGIPI